MVTENPLDFLGLSVGLMLPKLCLNMLFRGKKIRSPYFEAGRVKKANVVGVFLRAAQS